MLYYVDSLKPHFYIVKLGFTGVYIIVLISAQKHRLWVLVRTASLRRFSRVPTIYVLSRYIYEKHPNFYLKMFIFWWKKFSVYLNRHVFVMNEIMSCIFTIKLRLCIDNFAKCLTVRSNNETASTQKRYVSFKWLPIDDVGRQH